jgi:hypothetical protein
MPVIPAKAGIQFVQRKRSWMLDRVRHVTKIPRLLSYFRLFYLLCSSALRAFSILAHVSLSVTVRLNTGFPGRLSFISVQK